MISRRSSDCSATARVLDGQVKVLENDLTQLHESVIHHKYNFGAPSVAAKHVRVDGTLELAHDHTVDGRGLDLERTRRVLEYVHKVWRRPVILHTVDQQGAGIEIKTS